jgi:hypothetical protein
MHDLGGVHILTGIVNMPEVINELRGIGIDVSVNILIVYVVILLLLLAFGSSLYMLSDGHSRAAAPVVHRAPPADPTPPQGLVASAYLTAVNPAWPRIALSPGVNALVGRPSSATVTINNSHVSRRHLQIRLDDYGRIMVTDLGSTNGTYIEGKRLDPSIPVELRKGEQLVIGSEDVVYAS